MAQKLLLLTVFLCGFHGFSQQIKIINYHTGEPIANVALYTDDKTKSAISDFDGYVSLDRFDTQEIINFQHTSYKAVRFTKEQIRANNNIVKLEMESGKLDEIVFSVTRFGQDKRDTPQQVIGINPEEALFFNPQTTADILSNSGKVFVQKSQLGGGSPMIRGFSANRLLITVDGVRMNTAIFRGGNIQNIISIDPFVVENTEVILGPGSVVYGSDAIGGVMNFYTLQPKFSFVEGMSFSGNAVTRYATASQEKTAHVDFNIGLKEWAFLSSVTYNDFGDLRMGKHGPDDYLRYNYISSENGNDVQLPNENPLVQTPTTYNQLSLAQKIRFMPNDNWIFAANFLFSTTSNYSRYDRLTRMRDGNLRDAEWYYGPQVWFSGNLQAENRTKNTFYDKYKIIAAYQRFEESRNNRSVNSTQLHTTEEEVDAVSVNLDFTKNINDIELYYGAESVYNKVNSRGYITNIKNQNLTAAPSRYPDGSTWSSYAAYTSFLWKVLPEVTLQSGLRYSHFIIEASFNDAFYDFPFQETQINTGNLTGSTGISYQPNEILGLRANFATAFRAPNIDDIGKIFDSQPGFVVIPNPNLKAEYSYNGEIGMLLNFNSKVKIDMAVFYTKLENALVRRDFHLNGETEIEYQGELSKVEAIQNAADARSYGFEAGLMIDLSNTLKLISNYTITGGYELIDNNEKAPLRHAPPQFGNTRLVWEYDKIKMNLYANYSGGFSPDEMAPSEAVKTEIYPADEHGNLYSPSWHTINIATAYAISENWQATASLENITDQRYRTYSSGIAAPGRNLILALKYSF